MALLLMGTQRRMRILCTREIQNSIKDSVHKLLTELISSMGLSWCYEITDKTIRGINGTEFIFAGLAHNVDSIKSMEGIDIAWVEEARNVSEESWEILIPTIRKDGSEIWITFNPLVTDDYTYQRFVMRPPRESVVRKMIWSDNPWFPDVLRMEMEDLRERDYEAYRNVWLGECIEAPTGALWKYEHIHRNRYELIPTDDIVRMVVAIDPAVSTTQTSADTGIVVAALMRNQHVLVLEDLTCHASPLEWARVAVTAYHRHHADIIAGEINNGGDLVASNIAAINPNVPFRAVRAKRGKAIRAQPVASLYEQCVAAGSLVAMADGSRPIESIRRGDLAWTRKGLRRVLWAGCTGTRETLTITSVEGQTLTCTPDHLVLSWGNGFIHAGSLAPTKDTIELWNSRALIAVPASLERPFADHARPNGDGRLAHRYAHSLRLMESDISNRRMDIGAPVATRETNYCIESSGLMSTGRCHGISTFTTSTEIHPITTSLILRHWTTASIKRNTRELITLSVPAKESVAVNWSGGPAGSHLCTPAKNASRASLQSPLAFDFVLRPATRGIGIASVKTGPRLPVYDLMVEDDEEFFANGILVHNCRVHHVGTFRELESQMIRFVPGDEDTGKMRLDRMDALVWAITELVIDVEEMQVTRSMAQVVRISRY